jgi:hypothetical protein
LPSSYARYPGACATADGATPDSADSRDGAPSVDACEKACSDEDSCSGFEYDVRRGTGSSCSSGGTASGACACTLFVGGWAAGRAVRGRRTAEMESACEAQRAAGSKCSITVCHVRAGPYNTAGEYYEEY